jgi:hypothetical protein
MAGSVAGPVSSCEPFRAVIETGVERGLTAQRIWQDRCEEHDFSYRYLSVKQFVRGVRRRRPEVLDIMEHSARLTVFGPQLVVGRVQEAAGPRRKRRGSPGRRSTSGYGGTRRRARPTSRTVLADRGAAVTAASEDRGKDP